MANVNVQRFEPYKPPFCVWKLVESLVPVKELPLVKSYIGESLIEYCVDLRNELEILLDIWKEVGDRIEPPIVTKNVVNSVLPDRPKLKEILTKEIQLLVKDIQEKNGFSQEKSYKKTDEKVIQYAMLSQSAKERKSERPKTPLRKQPPDFSLSSPVKLKQIQRSINATSIEAVSEIIKDAINKECKQMEADIEFLQKCVEEQHEVYRSRPSSPIQEPSVAQLQQVCRTLEHRAMSQDAAPVLPPSVKLPTPPSPQRIQLKAIERKSSNSDSSHLQGLLNSGVTECWIEPSWTRCMTDSARPSTGDSGVASRPGTCELSALHERRKHLTAQLEPSATVRSSKDDSVVADGGYVTGSSLDFSHLEIADVDTNSAKLHASSRNVFPSPPPSTSISPHPPKKESVFNLPRRPSGNRRFSRKLVKTS